MPYTLATQRVQKSGGGGRLSAPTISNSAVVRSSSSAPTVNANAGRVGFRPTDIPPAVRDQTSEAINNFAHVAMSAAQAYQDRESSYRASEAALAFKDEARKTYEGYEDVETGEFVEGYQQSKGGTAVSGYDTYAAQLETKMKSMLEEMEPRVQQKAAIQMASTLNSYKGKAATHRSAQLNLAKEQQRAMAIKDVTLDIVSNPSGIDDIDPVTGMSYKGKFYSQFDKQTEADKHWYDTMEATTSLAYHNAYKNALNAGVPEGKALQIAAEQAERYFTGVSGPELAADPATSSRILGKLKRWNEEGVSALAQNERTTVAKQEQALKIRQRQVQTGLTMSAVEGDVLSNRELSQYAELDLVDSNYIRMYNNEYHAVSSSTTDPIILSEAREDIIEASKEDDFDPATVARRHKIETLSEYQELLQLGEDLKNPLQSGRMSKLSKYGSDLINITNVRGKQDAEAEAKLKSDVNRLIIKGIREGKNDVQILDEMELRLPKLSISDEDTLSFPQGERPDSLEDMQEVVRKYYDAAVSSPPNSPERSNYSDALRLYNTRIETLKAAEKAKKRREELEKQVNER